MRPARSPRTAAAVLGLLLVAPVAAAAPVSAASSAASVSVSATTSAAGPTVDRVPDRSRAYGPARARKVVERRVIGRSVRGRPIRAVRMGNPHASRTVLVLGQMHGDEPAGPRTVAAIRDHLRVDSDADLWLVPTMNPDGAAAGTRRNARGVDLNRNWPTSGWSAGDADPASGTYRGRSPGSERETRVVQRFLDRVRPDLVASVHQPLRAIGRNRKTPGFVDRLSRRLDLPARDLGVGTPGGRVSPTLTGWYNARYRGGAVTVEYAAAPSARYVERTAAHGLLHALLAHW